MREIPKLITFARECGAGKKFPPLGIQKFERYKYVPDAKRRRKSRAGGSSFNRSIKEWEKASGLVLRLDPKRDFGTVPPTLAPTSSSKRARRRT